MKKVKNLKTIHNDVNFKSKLAPSIFTKKRYFFIKKVPTEPHKCYGFFCQLGYKGVTLNYGCVDLTPTK